MKPFVRPPLVITTEPTKHNFYATFDPNTGKVTGMTPQKQGNCVEIDEYLANQIQKGKPSPKEQWFFTVETIAYEGIQ